VTTSVTVVDYGIGNIHSVVKALRYVGATVCLTADSDEVARSSRVVVPGVGAFADGMAKLRERNLDAAIVEHANSGEPLLGICLGMQLLLSASSEFGHHDGLGIIIGDVVPLAPGDGVKVPQIGWNAIYPVGETTWVHPLLSHLPPEPMVYFVHSYTASPEREEDRLADADYGNQRVSAAIARDNVVGFQFHPEKSGEIGLEILRRFLRT